MSELNDITATEMRVLLREHALVVAPGEVLVVQVPPTWSPVIIRELTDALRAVCGDPDWLGGVTIPVLVVPGTAVTVATMPEESLAAVDDINRRVTGEPGREHRLGSLRITKSIESDSDPAGGKAARKAAIRLSAVAWALNSLIDQGERAGIAEVHEHITDGSLWTWLREKFGLPVSVLGDEDMAAMLELFGALFDPDEPARNFWIERNGLATLLAYCVEGLQQLAES